MRNIRELIKLSTQFLKKRGIVHARREAEELLAALLNRKRLDLYFDYDLPIEEEKLVIYRQWIQRKGNHEPIAYILGEISFLDLKLKVTRDTLIPRQETEIFANLIIKSLPKDKLCVWDVCTGNGCLGFAIKNHRPDCIVTLSDLCPKALAIAEENARLNELSVEILEGDLLTPFKKRTCDVFICNPPYVTKEEYEEIEDEVRLYEPKKALVGGVEYYKRLNRALPLYLNRRAKLFFEIGAKQGNAVYSIFDGSYWKQKRFEKDWSGNDRFFFLEFDM